MVLVLFDIDGTLITSGGTGRRAIASALSDFCKHPVDMSTIPLGGRTDPAIVRDILKQAGFTDEEIPALIEPCLALYAKELERVIRPNHITILPGVLSLLNQLQQDPNYSLALITGNMQQTAYMKLGAGNLSSYFPCGGFGSDHENRNELPLVARDRAAQWYQKSFHPEKTIVIGDTEHDITCSKHFGSWSIGVSTGMSSWEALESMQPDLLLPDLAQEAPLWSFFQSVLDG